MTEFLLLGKRSSTYAIAVDNHFLVYQSSPGVRKAFMRFNYRHTEPETVFIIEKNEFQPFCASVM